MSLEFRRLHPHFFAEASPVALRELHDAHALAAIRAQKEGTSIGEGFKSGIVDIYVGLVAGARNMVSVGVATAAAGIVVGVVTMGLGGLVTDIIDTLSMGNLYMMLGIVAICSLILGMGLPTTANYIVMASLTAPALVTLA